jgi:hypothetical protein
MHRLCASILISLLVFCWVSSCRSLYRGRSITPGTPSVCAIGDLPAACNFEDNNFTIDYQVAKSNSPHSFTIDATATYHGSLTWQYYRNGVFTLLLFKNGVIVETALVSLARGSLKDEIRFARFFATHSDFDAVSITYKMDVSDIGGGIDFGRNNLDIVTGTIRSRPIR